MEARMNDLQYCPYCNHKMYTRTGTKRFSSAPMRYYYNCPSCGAQSPMGVTRKQAVELAAKVSVAAPQIVRASILERAFEITDASVWYEEVFAGLRNLKPAIITKDGSLLTEDICIDPSELDWSNYRKTWRLWTLKPSEALRKAVPLSG